LEPGGSLCHLTGGAWQDARRIEPAARRTFVHLADPPEPAAGRAAWRRSDRRADVQRSTAGRRQPGNPAALAACIVNTQCVICLQKVH